MLKMKEPKYVVETLRWCNKMRKKQGKEPFETLPRGRRKDPISCPCGKVTGLHVGGVWWGITHNDEHDDEHRLPSGVQRFIAAFDDGKLPQYELCKK